MKVESGLGFSLAVFMFLGADCTAGDDMARTEAEPHRNGSFVREDAQTLHEPVERRRR